MDRADPFTIAAAILATPLTTRLALTVRDPRLRERAAERVARAVLGEGEPPHPDQLHLPIA